MHDEQIKKVNSYYEELLNRHGVNQTLFGLPKETGNKDLKMLIN